VFARETETEKEGMSQRKRLVKDTSTTSHSTLKMVGC